MICLQDCLLLIDKLLKLSPSLSESHASNLNGNFIYICSAQSENLRNLEIALRILMILRYVQYTCVILRLCNTLAQSRDCATVVCNLLLRCTRAEEKLLKKSGLCVHIVK